MFVPSVGRVEVEQLAPRLEVPPGTFLCCCLDRLTCEEDGNRGCIHLAWMRLALCVAAQLDRAALCCVARGSTSNSWEQDLANPQGRCSRALSLLTVAAILAAICSIFAVASFAASCGCFLH